MVRACLVDFCLGFGFVFCGGWVVLVVVLRYSLVARFGFWFVLRWFGCVGLRANFLSLMVWCFGISLGVVGCCFGLGVVGWLLAGFLGGWLGVCFWCWYS